MLNILYLDKYIAVCHKPAGVLCEEGGRDSLPALAKAELSLRGESDTSLYTVHRLDRDTEGIVVLARSSSVAAKLSEQINEGRWSKIYLACLWGLPSGQSATLCDLLYYDRKRSKSFVVDRERKGVKSASLEYSVIDVLEDKKRTVVRVKLFTGRTHQIRVQFASRRLPLCGDRRYGAPSESGNTLALAAALLSFYHPETDEKLSFSITPQNPILAPYRISE